MGFGSPWLLWSLAAIAIPIIIHLFYFRKYKKIYFSDIKFLQEATIEQKKSGRLQHLLILLCRILTIIFLVLAFALPFLGNRNTSNSGATPILVYLDNTFSMNQIADNRSLLDEAKTAILTYLDQLPEHQQVLVLTNDIESQPKMFTSAAEAKKLVENIQFAPTTNTFKEWNHSVSQLIADSHVENVEVVYFSDFQSYALPEQWDSLFSHTTLIPIGKQGDSNISIDSIAYVDPIIHQNAENQVLVKIRNQGAEMTTQIHLMMNDEVVSVKDITLPADGFLMDTMSFVSKGSPWVQGKVSVNDAQIQFDNTMYFAAASNKNNQVLLLEDVLSSKAIFQLFNNDPHFILRRQHITQSQIVQNYTLIVLNENKSISNDIADQLVDYVKNGGNIYIIPSENEADKVYNSLLKKLSVGLYGEKIIQSHQVIEMNTQEPVVSMAFEKIPQKIDLPKVQQYWTISTSFQVPESSILKLDNGRPFIQKYQVGDGHVYLQASSLNIESSDFATKTIFAPLVYNFAVVTSQSQNIFYTIGDQQMVKGLQLSKTGNEVIKLKSGQYEMIPPVYPLGMSLGIGIPAHLEQDGIYQVLNGEKILNVIACNFDRKESEMKFTSKDELQQKYARDDVSVENLNEFLQKNSSGIWKSHTSLWKVCLILALIFLIAEILLIRFSTNNKSNEVQTQ